MGCLFCGASTCQGNACDALVFHVRHGFQGLRAEPARSMVEILQVERFCAYNLLNLVFVLMVLCFWELTSSRWSNGGVQQQQMAAGLNAGVAANANGLAGVQELLAQLNLAQAVQGQQQAGGGLGSDVTQV